MPSNTISQYVPLQPGATQNIKDNYPVLLDFLEAYYEWLETTGQPVNNIMNLRNYRDIDSTLDQYLKYFQDVFLPNIPNSVLADKRKLVKHIKQFYLARGSEKSYKFLFRILFNTDVQFYYPKVDMLRGSDGKWTIDKVIRTTTVNDTTLFLARQITGLTSGATANVENVVQYQIGSDVVSEIFISTLMGNFTIGETVEVILPDTTVAHETTYGLVTGVTIINPGTAYKNNDIIPITGSNQTGLLSVNVVAGMEIGRVVQASGAVFPAPATIKLSDTSSSITNYYANMFIDITAGTGSGQQKQITSYNPTTKVAIIIGNWSVVPDVTSQYQINLGQIKTIKVRDFGINYTSSIAANFTQAGNGDATGTISFGAVGTYAGRYANNDGFLSDKNVLQDSFFYQVFSYVLKSTQAIATYQNTVKTLLHPASLALFGKVIIENPTAFRRSHTSSAILTPSLFSGSLPTLNLETQYSCVEDLTDAQKLFDVSGFYPTGKNGYLGNLPIVDSEDPTWGSTGLTVRNTLVNASAVPINLPQQTMVVVGKMNSLVPNSGVFGCIDLGNDSGCSGFRITVNSDGSLVFRVQKVTTSHVQNNLTIGYPAGSINTTNYFFAVLRYFNNTLVGNLNQETPILTIYPTNVDALSNLQNSHGFYLGTGGFYDVMLTPPLPGFLPDATLLGPIVSHTPYAGVLSGFMDGIISYALVYNRYLSDSEVSDTYQFIKAAVGGRGITLF